MGLVSVLAVLLKRYKIVDAIAILLLIVGILGYFSFFLYLLSPGVGAFFSGLMAVVCVLLMVFVVRNMFLELGVALRVISPVFVLTLLVVFIGYYPFSSVGDDVWKIAANRWLNLPIDNWIPKIFADQIWNGTIQRPMIGDWLSSDRPPLQTGVLLVFYPLMVGNAVLYQTVGTMLQLLVIPATWSLLCMAGCSNGRPYIILAVCASSLVVVHSLFIWPKLISSAYVVLCFIYVWREGSCNIRWFVVGASAALAMLSHGGAFFALGGIFSVWFVFNIIGLSFKKIVLNGGAWAGTFFALMLPWVIYGKYVDPEFGRLIKWHLAGVVEPSQISVVTALVDSYAKVSFSEWLYGRLENFYAITAGNVAVDFFDFRLPEFFLNVRMKSFYYMFYSMWFFSPVLACFLWAIGGFPSFHRNVWMVFLSSVSGCVVWIVLMFSPGSTVIHQGSFFMWFGFFVWSAVVVFSVAKKIALLFLSLNMSLLVFSYFIDGCSCSTQGAVYCSVVLLLSSAFVVSVFILEKNERGFSLGHVSI